MTFIGLATCNIRSSNYHPVADFADTSFYICTLLADPFNFLNLPHLNALSDEILPTTRTLLLKTAPLNLAELTFTHASAAAGDFSNCSRASSVSYNPYKRQDIDVSIVAN